MSITITAQVTDAVGVVAVATATATQQASGDGSAGAPTGTPQFQSLRAAYATPPKEFPSFNVAGVDYRVGINTGVVLKNPALISMAGVSVSGHQVTVTGSNITLDGYDFSLNGGYGISCTGANLTVSNSKFVIGSALQLPIRQDGSGLTVLNCEIDGQFKQNGGGNVTHIQVGGNGPLVIKYSILQNGWSDAIDCQSGGTIDLHYNVFKDFGNINAHPDILQIEGNTYGPNSVTYNLCYFTAAGTYGPQGFFFTQTTGISLAGLTEVAYNTFISQATNQAAAMGPCIDIEMAHMQSTGTARVHDNWCDPTGVATNWGFADPETSWKYPQGKCWNNTNMLNGQVDQGKFAGTGP